MIGVSKFSASELIDVMKQMMERHWWGPLEEYSPGSGWELIEGFAEIWAEMSAAAEMLSKEGHASFAKGGSKAVTELTFSRENAYELTIKKGTKVYTKWGLIFELLDDVYWPAADSSDKNVQAQSLSDGYRYNVDADQIIQLREPTPTDLGDSTVSVTNQFAAYGGVFPMLDLLAANRGIAREQGESDESLRKRIRTLPDTVTPAAIRRTVEGILGPLGVAFEYVEGCEAGMRLSETGDGITMAAYTDAGVDPTSIHYGKFEMMLLSVEDTHRCFYIVVDRVDAGGGFGAFASETGDSVNVGNLHAMSESGDVTSAGFLDGIDSLLSSTYAAIYRAVKDKKAAGVRFYLIPTWSIP